MGTLAVSEALGRTRVVEEASFRFRRLVARLGTNLGFDGRRSTGLV